jgi:hypothetical protein
MIREIVLAGGVFYLLINAIQLAQNQWWEEKAWRSG